MSKTQALSQQRRGAVAGQAVLPSAVHCVWTATHRLSPQRMGLLGGHSQAAKFAAQSLFQQVIWPAGQVAEQASRLAAQRPLGHLKGEAIGQGHPPKLDAQEPSQQVISGAVQVDEHWEVEVVHLPWLGVPAGHLTGALDGQGQSLCRALHVPSQHEAGVVPAQMTLQALASLTHAPGLDEVELHMIEAVGGHEHCETEDTQALSQQRIIPEGHAEVVQDSTLSTQRLSAHLTGT